MGIGIRFKILGLFFLLAFLALIARLFFWQILKGKVLSAQARGQYEVGTTLSAPRGNIFASDGSWLAARESGWLVFASLPELKEDGGEIAESLAPFFVEKEDEVASEVDKIKGLLSKDGAVWIPLKHKISEGAKKNIEALGIAGIGFEEEEMRTYPEASAAAHLLGFVGKTKEGQDTGYFGLEGYYDLALSGKPGYKTQEADASGTPILLEEDREVSGIPGVDLITHIDKGLQMLVEKRLKEGIEKYGATAGSIIISDPTSGAIYASTSYPAYDPGKYFEFGNEFFKDPVISEAFEPGSIFKVLVMAAALDAGVVEPDTKCDICGGPLSVDKYTIETWNRQYRADSTMLDVIVYSDNVGMAYVGQRLGADKMYEYLDNFGIGKLTGIDLQGEGAPKLRDKEKWNVVDFAVASFGQGVAVTPIQMVKAVGAIANKGVVVTPQIVDRLKGTSWEEDIKPDMGRRVISKEVAAEVTAMMVEAAKKGEAKWTHLRGFSVAGKTGTAQIPISGHYDTEKTIASFIGFAPADEPKFLMLVTLREPQSSPWASETAAPLWYQIAKDLFLYFGIQPE